MNWALDLARVRQASSSALPLFGVVLYTDAHANIKKTLRDQDYWNALDEISGTKWAVFATQALAGKRGWPEFPPGTMGMMVPVWKEPSANRELLETFELSNTEQLPVLVVFVINDDELQRTVVPLDDSTSDTAFSSMREVFIKVADALNGIEDPRGVASSLFIFMKNEDLTL